MLSVCADYMSTGCSNPQCAKVHNVRICYNQWKTGYCRFGARCRYLHHFESQETCQTKPSKEELADEACQKDQKTKKHVGKKEKSRRSKNTENFTPSHTPSDMRVVFDANPTKYTFPIQTRDVIILPSLFSTEDLHKNVYERVVHEMSSCGIPLEQLLKPWHGDTHWIADDSLGWKKHCPTIVSIIDRIQSFFGMTIRATRLNWYRDCTEWKPFHHDAAAIKAEKALTQNFTVAASFGATREAAFEEVETKKTVSFQITDGSVYCFARDVNIRWRHGIPQRKPSHQQDIQPASNEGRISLIVWGWIDQIDV